MLVAGSESADYFDTTLGRRMFEPAAAQASKSALNSVQSWRGSKLFRTRGVDEGGPDLMFAHQEPGRAIVLTIDAWAPHQAYSNAHKLRASCDLIVAPLFRPATLASVAIERRFAEASCTQDSKDQPACGRVPDNRPGLCHSRRPNPREQSLQDLYT